MMQSLKINELLTVEQAQRLTVHYNFLSMFVHPNGHVQRYVGTNNPSLLKLVVSLYILKIQELLIRALLSRRKTLLEERKGETKELEEKIEQLTKNCSAGTGLLWFIYDNPFGKKYYVDPYKRVWDTLALP
jgi:hypothetical protein